MILGRNPRVGEKGITALSRKDIASCSEIAAPYGSIRPPWWNAQRFAPSCKQEIDITDRFQSTEWISLNQKHSTPIPGPKTCQMLQADQHSALHLAWTAVCQMSVGNYCSTCVVRTPLSGILGYLYSLHTPHLFS